MTSDDYYGSDIRFGKIAFKLGYITLHQLKEALCEQVEGDLSNLPHRLLGKIMLQKKWMTLKKIENVLAEMSTMREGEDFSTKN